jgi:WD40 repeat protein
MMSTTFEERKLQSTFTLRIAEAVKKMKIQPMPRTAGLPWGLSLATGIVLAILNFSPYPGILNRSATGSPLPGETKVLRIGEIPVDILKLSEVPVLASKQGDGDGGEPGSSATLAAAYDEENTRTQENREVITDPETGVEYIKTRTLTGEKDVIKDWSFSLSPNGEFLLWNKLVIPLGDGEPFDLVDVPASRGIWSPDGRKVVFCSEDAIWVIPVSPETGRATGPAEKLLDGEHWYEHCCWSPDSERIVISRRDREAPGNICILSVQDGMLTQITNSGRENRPIWSPDGKTIAYLWGYQLRAIPAEGGSPRKLVDKGRLDPISWSPDSQWLVYFLDGLRFLRLADEREFVINPPNEVGLFASWSPDGKWLSYNSDGDVKIRPGGEIWEADVSEFLSGMEKEQ